MKRMEVFKIKILFLCSRNKWRSYTAEKIFHGVNGHEVRSAGTENNARIKVPADILVGKCFEDLSKSSDIETVGNLFIIVLLFIVLSVK